MGMTKATREILSSLHWSADSTRPGAISLAAIFTAQASKASTYTNAQAMSDGTARDCHAALGEVAYRVWYPALLKPLRDKWVQFEVGGKRLTTSDLAEIYREIALALREVY
jgi:hypothetical protein